MIRTLAGAAFTMGMLAVVVLSLLPQEALPGVHVSDKFQHLIAYLCLALAGGVAFPAWRSLIVLGLGLVALGIGMEIGQAFVPGRSASAGDVIANTLGVLIGLTVARVAGGRAGLSA